ncbi:MAG: HlyD family efflux transporter periplasmic adaptor subunit [Boseongicola sp. SB0662_bin_57]|nr:HlyD family efflux transporter periplasmic adaptor subunit [Boseongicola sp. SB0662_bin_57]
MSQQSTNPGNPSGERHWRGYAQALLIIFVVAVALYLARAPERTELGPVSAPADAAPVVQVIVPSPAEHVLELDLTGTVTLDRKLTVVSEIEGRVVWVSADFVNGGSIQADEAIVRIDPREYELEVRSAKMAVAKAEAQVQLARRATGPDAGLVIAEAEAGLGQAEAKLALANLQLERTEISLPFDARVMSSELEVGDLVGPPDDVGKLSVLGVVYRPEALQVRVPIKVEDLDSLGSAVGRPAQVRTANATYEAGLARISSVVALESRLAKVFLKFPDNIPRTELPVPGTFAEITIFGPSRDDVFVLPEAAAREQDSVWIVRDGALRALRPETIGRSNDGWVVEAFEPGEGVVVSVIAGASEGLRVSPEPALSGQ